jgi:hypothetical protein
VRNEDATHRVEPERARLALGGVLERARSDEDRRLPLDLEPDLVSTLHVVQLPQSARASITKLHSAAIFAQPARAANAGLR